MTPAEIDDLAQIVRMATFLGEVGYRDLSPTAAQQRIAVCRRLWRSGVGEQLLRMLWSYAQSLGQSPVRLFCWWIDRPSRTIEKVNELRTNEGWAKRALLNAHEGARELEKEGRLIEFPKKTAEEPR